MRCTVSAGTPSSSPPAAGTTRSPSRPTSPPCAERCAGCHGRLRLAHGDATGGHGRRESRSIKVIDLEGTGIAALFPAARRAIKVVRRRTTADGHRSVETVYALTSLDHRVTDLAVLAAWLRGHWEIENRVHHVRDVTQREDASRIRTGNGPQVMAALRNTATNIARLAGHDNIAAAQRTAAWHPTAITDALNAA